VLLRTRGVQRLRGQLVMNTLHERIAQALGWTLESTQSFSMPALRELVRPVSPKLAAAITERMTDCCPPDAPDAEDLSDTDGETDADGPTAFEFSDEALGEPLPFGVAHADDLLQPFCACGRPRSACDRSRKGCTP